MESFWLGGERRVFQRRYLLVLCGFNVAMDPFHDIDPCATSIQEVCAHEELVAASVEYISESKSSQGDESDLDGELDLP